MSTTTIKTKETPEEPQLQSGDLVTTVQPHRLWFGRVFDAGESTVRIWWPGLDRVPSEGGLVTHQTTDVEFVERPDQYLTVLFETGEGSTYAFVVAGDDVTNEERTFDAVPHYTIISRRTAEIKDHDDDTTSDTGR